MTRLLLLLLLLAPGVASAQPNPGIVTGAITVPVCNAQTLPVGKSVAVFMDINGNLCVSGSGGGGGSGPGGSYSGNGSLALTTSSTLLNTLTANSSSGPLPSKIYGLTVINVGSTDAALCPNTGSAGATCTCPENSVAATNGITLLANGGGYTFSFTGILAANPSVVACSGTTTIQVQW